ncbi:hypothetical protein DL770_007395 [Monosporascus sp. CRB-9-2]|nr:hypothetical protein DL770_007395 [Monosporascus sp. CRB-9-2]
MNYDFKGYWEYLKTHMVSLEGEAMTLDRLRAAAQYRLEGCDPGTLTLSYLQHEIIGDLYRSIAAQEARMEAPRQLRLPHEPKIEKAILLRLVEDASLSLDALERAIETNAREHRLEEYRLGTQPPIETNAEEYRLGTQPPTPSVVAAQQRMQREFEDKMKDMESKLTAPQVAGGGPWEVILPSWVDPVASIKPHQPDLEYLLEVHLLIRSDRLEVGQPFQQLKNVPPRFRPLPLYNKRFAAFCDLAAYAKHSLDTGAAPDILDFLVARQHDIISELEIESAELRATVTREYILSSEVMPPAAPHGEYLEWCLEHRETREGEASNTGNRTAGEN